MKKHSVAILTAIMAMAAWSDDFFLLKHDQWVAFSDPTAWGVGTTKEATNPDNRYPGENDYIFQYSSVSGSGTYAWSYFFTLTATEAHPSNVWTVKALAQPDGVNGNNYNPTPLKIFDGTLRFSESFSNTYMKVTVQNGAKFEVMDTADSRLGRSGCGSCFNIESGGELYLGGVIHLKNPKITNEAGATATIKPSALYFDYDANAGVDVNQDRYIDNSGTLSLPNGFLIAAPVLAHSNGFKNNPPVFKIYQRAGTFTVGGDMGSTDTQGGKMYVELSGGKVTFSETVNFSKTTGSMPDGASVEIEIAAGKTLNLSEFTFGSNTSLKISGAGKVILGASAPTTLTLDGVAELALSKSIHLNTVSGYAEVTCSFVDPWHREDLRVSADDATLFAKFKAAEPTWTGRVWDDTEDELHNYVTDSKIFIWTTHSSTYYSYADTNMWLEGTRIGVATPATVYPASHDWIGFVANKDGKCTYFTQSYDLGGQHYKVKGIYHADLTDAELGYGYRKRSFRNGTFEFTDSYFAHRDEVTVQSDGKFIIAPTCVTDIQWGGAENWYDIYGELDWQGTISLCSLRIVGYAGSTVNFAPSVIALNAGAGTAGSLGEAYSCLDNSGTMYIPYGLAFTGVSRTAVHPYHFYQRAGEMTIGGDFTGTANVEPDYFHFDLIGGTLNVVSNSVFTLFDEYGMPTNGSTATINIAAGKTLDWRDATFAEDTTLNLTGAGTIILGVSQPTTINITGTTAITLITSTTLNTIEGYENTTFSVLAPTRDDLTIVAADEGLRAKVAEGSPGAGRQWVTEGNEVISRADSLTFLWANSTSTYYAYTNYTARWLVGTRYGATTAAPFYPGENDWIGFGANVGDTTKSRTVYSFDQYYDLGGQHYRVKGISSEGIPDDEQGYGYRYRAFKNGTMEFTDSYYAHRDVVTVLSDGKLILSPTCTTTLRWSGAENVYKIFGELDWQGTNSLCSLRINAYAGSIVNFAPSAIELSSEAGNAYSSFDNQGTMKFPHGLAFTSVSGRKTAHPYGFYQRSGEMVIGGNFTGDAIVENDNFTFDLIGGQLSVISNSSFTVFDSYGMPTNNTTATIDIAEGKTLEWTRATFAEETTLNVTGAGAIALGDNYPTTLNLAEGVKLTFATDVNLDTKTNVIGLADADFVVTSGLALPRAFTVTTTNQTLQAKLAAIVLPENWTKTELTNGVMFALPPEVFVWYSSATVNSYDDYVNWSVGAVENVKNNPQRWIPGPQDMLLYGTGGVYKKLYLNLNGKNYQLGGIYGDGANWNTHDMSVENGTLEIVSNFSNYYYLATIKDGGRFVLGANSVSRLGYSGAMNNYTIQSGGEVDWLGAIEIANSKVYVNAGATFTFDPVKFSCYREAYEGGYAGRGIFNSGTMNAPHGIVLESSSDPIQQVKKDPMVYTVQNLAGATLNLGGDIQFVGEYGKLRLDVQGGTLNVTDDAQLSGLDAATFANAVSLNVAATKTFDLTAATFASGATLTVDGAIKLGTAQPATLNLASGSQVTFMEMGTTLGTITGYADATFAYGGEPEHGKSIVISDDATMLAAILARMTPIEGWTFAIRDNAIVAESTEPNPDDVTCFQSDGEKSLGDDQGSWNTEGGAVPQEGDVFVSGANTIAVLDADTVAYDSISVMRGATLKVTGTVENLPAITLYYGAKLLFAEDAVVSLANAITSLATEELLPTVELKSGAKVVAAAGYEFKNLYLKNDGWLQFAGAGYIGTANVGETAFFKLTAEGGRFDFTSNKEVRWLGPKTSAGGRVHVVSKVLLKDAFVNTSVANTKFRISVSRDNPSDEVFDFELDNTILMLESNAAEVFGGGVQFKCVNGGKIQKSPSTTSPGLYGEMHFNDALTATFDGSDSRLLYFYNRYKVYFGSVTTEREAMTFKNGAYFHVMNFIGESHTSMGFEDGFWDVTELPGYDSAYWNNIDGKGTSVPKDQIYRYLVAPFTGFKSIRIASGKTLGIRSYSVNEISYDSKKQISDDRRWNRSMQLANVPVVGDEGSMFVTNATVGQSLSVTLTCGSNTATGDLWAEPSEYGCELMLADGANWAGTLVASETIGFTNLTDAAAAATVTVNNIRFAGKLPIRVWKGATAAENAADRLTILGTLAKTKGGFAPVEMNGTAFALGDTFTIGTIPAAQLPANYERGFTNAKWKLVAEGDGETKTLKLVYEPASAIFILK